MFGVDGNPIVVDWGLLAIVSQVLILFALAVYFITLNRAAQDAALFAMPRRRFLQRYKFGRRALALVTPRNASTEHVIGKVDLLTFAHEAVAPNPVARGDLFARLLKRGLDIVAALTLLLFASPLLLVVAVLVKLDSKGPIFYRQVRVGRHGRSFEILKFRSMRVDAEKDGAQWANVSDSRITRIGSFLRRSRIDEIPQTINILLGHMSFVGPRPERPEFTAMLAETIPHFDERHLMKPGLTGWAQINYPYGASIEDSREKLAYDLYYIKNFSLILDLFIIIRTVKVALLGLGSR